MDFIQSVQRVPECFGRFWLRCSAFAKLAEKFAMCQSARRCTASQLFIFFFGQAYFDTLFFFFHFVISILDYGVFRGNPLSKSACRQAANLDCGVTIRCSLYMGTRRSHVYILFLPFHPTAVFVSLPLVVASSISFVSVQARKAHSFRCSSSPQKVLRLFGDPMNRSVAALSYFLKVIARPPLAVPEKGFGRLPALTLVFFDRCANPASLHPPPAALGGVARSDGYSVFKGHERNFPSLVPTGRAHFPTLFAKNFCLPLIRTGKGSTTSHF